MVPIYLDHAASTPLDRRVLDAMIPFLTTHCGNASSPHAAGRRARVAVEKSRERVAAHLGAHPSEIVFTSGGTESNNAAIRGVLCHTPKGLVTSASEHASVLKVAQALRTTGAPVAVLQPDPDGSVRTKQIENALSSRIGLVSMSLINNELGTVAPIREFSIACQRAGVPLHVDAVQAATVMEVNAKSLGADLMTLSGHKLNGPKGVGVLYVRAGLDFRPLIVGGSQERRRRGGTENVAAIVGMATALDLAAARQTREAARLLQLRRSFEQRLKEALGETLVFNTPVDGPAAPHILHFSLRPWRGRQIDGEMLLLNLDMAGVMVSAGAACASGAVRVSHVLRAIGLDDDTASASVRVSLGRSTSATDVEEAADRLVRIVDRMRRRRAA